MTPLPPSRRAASVTALAGFVLLVAPGCVSDDTIKPRYEMIEKKIAVIPFEDPIYPKGMSRVAIEISRVIAKDIAANEIDDIEVVPSRVVEAYFETRDIHSMSPQEIGRALGVDCLIFGKILKFDTRGDIVGLDQGEFRAIVKVQDVVQDEEAFEDEARVHYPGQPITGLDEETIKRNLIRKAGRSIGRWFYAYEPEGESMELPK